MTAAPDNFSFRIRRPDDWHIHHRDETMMAVVVPMTARQFARTTAMPNLIPPVTTVDMAESYHDRLKKAAPDAPWFNPQVPLYLTDQTPRSELEKISESAAVHAIKYYPPGATTNSASGVTSFEKLFPILEIAEELDIPFQMHGEVVDADVDVFDREAVFIDRHLTELVKRFPNLRMVLEHNTTKEAVEFVSDAANKNVYGTITPIHLLHNRTDMLGSGMQPHLYCAPIVKARPHQEALIKAATSGSPKFFAGTDSAPHIKRNKENWKGHFGTFSAFSAVEFYAEIFDTALGLQNESAQETFENFMSVHGATFYRFPLNEDKITLTKSPTEIPQSFKVGDEELVPIRAGGTVAWSFS